LSVFQDIWKAKLLIDCEDNNFEILMGICNIMSKQASNMESYHGKGELPSLILGGLNLD
jgi:hypothetical protein